MELACAGLELRRHAGDLCSWGRIAMWEQIDPGWEQTASYSSCSIIPGPTDHMFTLFRPWMFVSLICVCAHEQLIFLISSNSCCGYLSRSYQYCLVRLQLRKKRYFSPADRPLAVESQWTKLEKSLSRALHKCRPLVRQIDQLLDPKPAHQIIG